MENGKRIKQVADELNISTQALYTKINKTYKKELAPYIYIENNQKIITLQGVELLKKLHTPTQTTDDTEVAKFAIKSDNDIAKLQTLQSKKRNDVATKYKIIKKSRKIAVANRLQNLQSNEPEVANLKNELFQRTQKENEYLHKEIQQLKSDLEKERDHSRQQAERFADISQQLAELTRNSQVLLKQEQEKTAFLLPSHSDSDTDDPTDEQIKNTFWSRFFKKKGR